MLNEGIKRLTGNVDQAFVDTNYQTLLDAYERGVADNTRFFDGVEDALGVLKNQGHRIGICTNKPYYLTEALLDALDAAHWVEAVLGADSLPVRKPDAGHYFGVLKAMNYEGPSLLVGDTVTDLKTAEAANVPCILCDFGALESGARDYSPAAMLYDYTDLPRIVAQVLEDISDG